MKPYIFRVHREKVGDETIRILLEPYSGTQRVSLNNGDEFITGALTTDPWDEG